MPHYSAAKKGSIVYAGALAQVPRQGGLTWFHLQFLVGLRRLGWNVLFLDWLHSDMCVDRAGNTVALHESLNLKYFKRVMTDFALDDAFSLEYDGGRHRIGLSRKEVLDYAARCDLLINVMGYLRDEEVLNSIQRRVFLDIDPGFGQMWKELGWCNPFCGHNAFVTCGRNIGHPLCTIPTCGLSWLTMPQPVVLDQWPLQAPVEEGRFTSIGAWRGPNDPIEYQGHTYGLRVHEFRQFMELPSYCRNTRFEMALDIHPDDHKDIHALHNNGWRLEDPKTVAGGPAEYRDYIARSKAEVMVPKQMYVDTNSGLLSDRSAYYLASGRPVLARDTGIRDLYPTGEGLLTFATLEEAVAGVEEINSNYQRHRKAAREIAVEYFDSDKVLTSLLADLGVN